MKRRAAFVAAGAVVALGTALLACVDLFHATNFDTLCSVSPNDPSCSEDASGPPDAAATDAAGVDAARPHPDFCQWSSDEARAQAIRACAWLGACEGPLGESRFGPCVVRAQLAFNCSATPTLRPAGAVDEFWGCLATVTSCGDVDRCVFPATNGVQDCIEVTPGASTNCGAVGANQRVRVKCSGPAGRPVGVDPCVMRGQTCAAETGSIAECSGTQGYDCATTACAGGGAVDCNLSGIHTFDKGVDCRGIGGGACTMSDAGPACLAGKGTPSCDGEPAPVCVGSIATSCVEGEQIRVSCDAIGLPCDVSEPVAPYDLGAACVDRAAGACSTTDTDTCTGLTTLESCGRGAPFSVDCATLGLGKCKLDAAGFGSCTAPTK